MSSGKPQKTTEIINPKKLAPARRDSICAQCHLTEVARVASGNSNTHRFRAGEVLTKTVAIYTWSNAESDPVGVTSHFRKVGL